MAEPGLKPATLVLKEKTVLGEGAIWHPDLKKLIWIDILGRKLFIYDPGITSNSVIELPGMPGTVVPAEGDDLLVALDSGLYIINLKTEKITFYINPEENKSENRFNDGKSDPAGRMWIGSMDKKGETGRGSVYRIDQDGSFKKIIPAISIPNGFSWSPDGKRLYFSDSPTRQVKGFNYDISSGNIKDSEVVIEFQDEEGFPDGMTIDEEGMLWIAQYGAGKVGRWNPFTGEKLDHIDLPVPNVTSCAFGGDDLDILFITTGTKGLSAEELEKFPESGSLFSANPGIKGLPANFFRKK